MHSWYADQERSPSAPRGSWRGRIVAAAVGALVLAALAVCAWWLVGGIGAR